MVSISKTSAIYLFLIVLISYIVAQTALSKRNAFDRTNVPVYDGVMYEYQQLKRYQKFDGDFSLKNRFSQSVYEYRGNPVGGMYSLLLTFFAPTFLQNDIDILIRSFIGLVLFNLAFFTLFRRRYSEWWTFCLLLLISQVPVIYDYRIGIGAYTPELIGAIYLLAGYFFLYQFILYKRNIFFIIGIVSFLFPLSFRYNFFAYASLLSLPLIFLFIRDFSSFNYKRYRLILLFGILIILIYLLNFFYHFHNFYGYYTKVCYAIGNLKDSLLFYSLNIKEFYGKLFLILLLFVFIGNILFKRSINISTNKVLGNVLMVIYPYMVYSGFVIFIMNSTNTPHIMSISLFFGVLILPIFQFFRLQTTFEFQSNKLLKITFSVLVVLFCLGSFLSNYLFNKNSHPEKAYTTQRFTVDYIKKHPIKSMFNCYDAMLDIPINTSLFNENKKMVEYTGTFVIHDIYLHYTCKNFKICLDQYVNQINKADLIVINEKETGPYIFPMAKKIRIKLRALLLTSKTHKLVFKKYFPYYGNILFYRMR